MRNRATLEPTDRDNPSDNNKQKQDLWEKPFYQVFHKEPQKEERYTPSRVALRENVHQKRNVYKAKMVEDLMNVTLEYEYTNSSLSDEIWTPKGRLVAHVNEHSQAVNQLSLSDNYSMMVSASDDQSIRVWTTDQFLKHSEARVRNPSIHPSIHPSGSD